MTLSGILPFSNNVFQVIRYRDSVRIICNEMMKTVCLAQFILKQYDLLVHSTLHELQEGCARRHA